MKAELDGLKSRCREAVLARQLNGRRGGFTAGDRAFLAALLHGLPKGVLRRLRLLVRPGHGPAPAP
ncbi:hypothetical protein SCOCK_300111 [Actinacidiphila cocklensis]|uniref:Uncharacterized protein n=1 Tax=Actinacidiphila cocklensis TaxID=887465 RepID=A0A9W4GSC2_9ACTN|nr:hypothetical protein SCOCK_300111 [Actinacidiphila cocklensis]